MVTKLTVLALYPTCKQDALMPQAHVMTGNSGTAYDSA